MILVFSFQISTKAQILLRGTVYDSARKNYVENVMVQTTSGAFATTDSLGEYKILMGEKDSITFTFRKKPTPKYTIKDIVDFNHFDIQLHLVVRGKYAMLNEVVVRSKTYRQDSIENRMVNADIFERKNPTLKSSITPDGMVGADLDELINIFRFKRNKQLKQFKTRMIWQEKEVYVTHRFNSVLVKKLTGLVDPQLADFLVKYRPDYDFIKKFSDEEFKQQIIKWSYQYKINLLKK